MKQSRGTSMWKSLISTGIGFAVALAANALVLPLFGFSPSLKENFAITCIYTAISIARGYAVERLMEAIFGRVRMSAFALAVLAERERQIAAEGWTPQHDDFEHQRGDLAHHGGLYAQYARNGAGSLPPVAWRWNSDWWKPVDFRRNLVKGAALILAEGERHDRMRKRSDA